MNLSELKNNLNKRSVEDVETVLFVYGLDLFRVEDFRMYDHLRDRLARSDVFNLCYVAAFSTFLSCNIWYRHCLGVEKHAISQGVEINDAYERLRLFMKRNYGRELRCGALQESCSVDVGTIDGIANWLLTELLDDQSLDNIVTLRVKVEERLTALTRDEPINDYLIDLDNAKEMSKAHSWPISYKDYMMREAEKKLFGNRRLT